MLYREDGYFFNIEEYSLKPFVTYLKPKYDKIFMDKKII